MATKKIASQKRTKPPPNCAKRSVAANEKAHDQTDEPLGLSGLDDGLSETSTTTPDELGLDDANDGLGATSEERARAKGERRQPLRHRHWPSFLEDQPFDALQRHVEVIRFTTTHSIVPPSEIEDTVRELWSRMRDDAIAVGSIVRTPESLSTPDVEAMHTPEMRGARARGVDFRARNAVVMNQVSDVLSVLSGAIEQACGTGDKSNAARMLIREFSNRANAHIESPLRKPAEFRKFLFEQFHLLRAMLKAGDHESGEICSSLANAIGLYGFNGVRRGRVSTPRLAGKFRDFFVGFAFGPGEEGIRDAVEKALSLAGVSNRDIDSFVDNVERQKKSRQQRKSK